jgi:hypothetical protein
MSLLWKTILTNVPWSDVLGKAPVIAEGAKKLWQGLGRKNGEAAVAEAEAFIAPDADHATRLTGLEAAQRKLRTQLLASGELIQALSEQNTQLVAQVETLRRRAHYQGWGLAATALLATLALLLVWQPRLTEFFA